MGAAGEPVPSAASHRGAARPRSAPQRSVPSRWPPRGPTVCVGSRHLAAGWRSPFPCHAQSAPTRPARSPGKASPPAQCLLGPCPRGPPGAPCEAPPWCLPAPGTDCLSLSSGSAAGCPREPPAQHLRWGGEAGFHAQRGPRRVASPCLSRQGGLGAMEGRGPVLRRRCPPQSPLPGLAELWRPPRRLRVKAPDSVDSGALHPALPRCPTEGAPRRSQRLPGGCSLTLPGPRAGGLWGGEEQGG